MNFRHRLYELFCHLDAKYVKSLLIRDGAENILALRMRDLALEEHWTRLYGSVAAAHIHEEEEVEERESRYG